MGEQERRRRDGDVREEIAARESRRRLGSEGSRELEQLLGARPVFLALERVLAFVRAPSAVRGAVGRPRCAFGWVVFVGLLLSSVWLWPAATTAKPGPSAQASPKAGPVELSPAEKRAFVKAWEARVRGKEAQLWEGVDRVPVVVEEEEVWRMAERDARCARKQQAHARSKRI